MIRCKKIAVILAVFSAMGMVVQGQGNGDSIALSQNVRTPLPALAPAAYRGHFWRVDAENDASLPRNFRTCQSPFHAVEHKYASEIDSSYIPSRKGLDDLRISGSGQFSARQFDALVQALRKKTKGPIYDVDLRQESHGFFNGMAATIGAISANLRRPSWLMNSSACRPLWERTSSSTTRGKAICPFILES